MMAAAVVFAAADAHGGSDATRSAPETVISLQCLQQLLIRSREFVLIQLFAAYPSERRAAERLRFMGNPDAAEEPEVNRLARVLVNDRFDEIADSDLDSQFLFEFAQETVLERLVQFALPTRELPQSGQMPAGRALRDQQASVTKD